MDKHISFQKLREFEAPDSFGIVALERVASNVIVIAPHGGKIEPHTSTECGRAI